MKRKCRIKIGSEILRQLPSSKQFNNKVFKSEDLAHNFILGVWGSGTLSHAEKPTGIYIEVIK